MPIELDRDELVRLCPRGRSDIIDGLVQYLPAQLERRDIETPLRFCHFIAQFAQETDGFQTLEEYASGAAYEGRKDLGNTKPGDGERYKGRGGFMLTGRFNYKTYGGKIGEPLEDNPELAGEPAISAIIATTFWTLKKLNRFADADDVRSITKAINGGYTGLDDRRAYLRKAKSIWMTDGAELDIELEPGSQGAMVKELQTLLKARGYPCGDADGKWGTLTTQSVLALKSDNNLSTEDPSITLRAAKAAPVRVIASRATATVKDVRATGSSTISVADTGQKVGWVAVGGAALTGATDHIKAVGDTVSTVTSSLQPFYPLMHMLHDYWYVGAGLVGGLVIWYLAKVKSDKVESYKNGEQL